MKRSALVFVISAIVLLMIPAVLFVFGVRDLSRENRSLSPKPELISDGRLNEGFFSDFESWFSERFPLRSYLIEAFNTLDSKLLSDVNTKSAIVGKDDYIFFGETVSGYLGSNTLSESELSSIVNYLSFLESKANEIGAGFVFVTAPDKASVYPELMPSYLKPTANEKNGDLLFRKLAENGVSTIDLKALLLDAKKERSVYYKHDSHWNDFGACLVYNAIAKMAGLEFFDAYTYETAFDHTGDLHYFVHPVADYREERIVYPVFHEWKSKRPIDFDRDKEIETASDVNGLTLLVFHDSFGRSLQPFFSEAAGKLYMNAYFPYDEDLIYDLAPDYVVIELVERNIPLLAEYAASQGF